MSSDQACAYRLVRILVMLFAASAIGSAAAAQTTSQIPLQFDFLTPGARSMAMGGAFVGAADDTTAAFTNPAGLGFLSRRQISGEVRFRQFTTPFLAGGRISGLVTGRGLDVIPTPIYLTDEDTSVSPAFFSFMMPLQRGVLTVYAHDMVRIENTFLSSGVFERFTFGGVTDDNARETPVGGTRKVTVAVGGATFAHAFLDDRVSVGAGISVGHLNLDASFTRFGFESLFGPVRTDVKIATATQESGDFSAGWNAGILVKAPRKVKIGATFRKNPGFHFTQEDRVFDANEDLVREGRFKVPDVFGSGVEWQPGESFRVLADYDFVRYSQLKRDYIDFQAISSGRQAQIELNDGHEWHTGVEYSLNRMNHAPLLFRGGLWRDPDHAPRYVPTPQHDELDVLLAATLPGGRDLTHYTFGGGVAFLNGVEMDAALDHSDRTTYVTFSVVVTLR